MVLLRKRKTSVKEEYSSEHNSESDFLDDGERASESDSEYDEAERKSPMKKAKTNVEKKPKVTALPSKAYIVTLAENPDEAAKAKESVANVEENILNKIIKALNLANHPGTGEQEAKAALRMAHKLMAQHSVTQAAVLATMGNSEEKLQKAGMSAVAIRSENGKLVRLSDWSSKAGQACCKFFNCKFYTTAYDDKIEFSFYGLIEQTVATAYAFEMVYNLIMTWRMGNKKAKGLHGKNSYCHGVADGLYTLAKEEERKEEKAAKRKEQMRLEDARRQEKEERQRQIERLKDPKIEVKPEIEERKAKVEEVEDDKDILKDEPEEDSSARGSDDDDDDDDDNDDPPRYDDIYRHGRYGDSDSGMSDDSDRSDDSWDDESNEAFRADFQDSDPEDLLDLDAPEPKVKVEKEDVKPVKKERESSPKVTVKNEEVEDTPWESAGQLVTFRETASAIADDYLKTQNLKLRTRRKRQRLQFKDAVARDVYHQGREDAKKIDVKRRRIKDTEEDLVY